MAQAEPRSDGLNVVRASHWLFMLIHAQRHRGVTIKSVGEAAEPPVAGPNLSVFITTSGQSRNVKAERLEQMLLMLGVLRDGLLTPGLHRWDITRHADDATSRGLPRREVDTLIDLLDENSKGMATPLCVCLTWSGGKADDAVLPGRVQCHCAAVCKLQCARWRVAQQPAAAIGIEHIEHDAVAPGMQQSAR